MPSFVGASGDGAAGICGRRAGDGGFRLGKLAQCCHQRGAAQQCFLRSWLAKVALGGQRASLTLLLRTQMAGSRQPIQPVKQAAHRSGRPKPIPPCCRDAACCEGGGDGIWRGYAARPYLGNYRSECGSPRIRLRRANSAGSLTSLRRQPRLDCHFITMTEIKPPTLSRHYHGSKTFAERAPVRR